MKIDLFIKEKDGIFGKRFRMATYVNTFFDKIDTELKAYLLGYLIADGCITIENRKNRPLTSKIRRIQFQPAIEDIQVIELMRDSIAPDNKITVVKAKISTKQDTIKFRIACKYMVDKLMSKYKIVPRKTWDYSFTFPKMSKHLKRHFIRGYFDGDGSVGKSHFSFIFNSRLFLEEVLTEINKSCKNLKSYIYEEKRSASIYYSLHFSINRYSRIELFNYLYKNCNYKLDRKYNKFYNTVLNSKSKELLSV